MRRLDFAIAGVFASLLFFSDGAPGNYRPETSRLNDAFRLNEDRHEVAPRVPAVTASTQNVEPEAPESIAAETDDLLPALPPSEPRKPTSLDRARMALAETGATALPDHELCTTLAEVARSNDLPLGFFTNLIWRESRFDHDAISPVGAMGIAQFMPDVADKLSLDAFDARSALPASARLLRTLRARFGNLGLAAAAYNAGPKRVSDWLEGRSALPKETQDYVHLITGRPAAHWQTIKPQAAVFRVPQRVPCLRLPTFALTERLERAQQEQIVAEEARLAALRAREAARRLAEEKRKHKVVAQTAHQRIAVRLHADKPAAVRPQRKIQLAQIKR